MEERHAGEKREAALVTLAATPTARSKGRFSTEPPALPARPLSRLSFPSGSLSVSPRSPHQFPLCIVRSCVVSYEPSIRSTFPYVIEHLPPSTPGTVVHARDTKMIGTRPLPLRRSLGRALACNTGPILCHRPLVSASFPSCQTAFPEHAHASPVALPIQ